MSQVPSGEGAEEREPYKQTQIEEQKHTDRHDEQTVTGRCRVSFVIRVDKQHILLLLFKYNICLGVVDVNFAENK